MTEGPEGSPPARAPEQLALLAGSRALELDYGGEGTWRIPYAALRAASPAAGSDPGGDYADVTVVAVEPVGNYAIQPRFSDGHTAGIYSWETLAALCRGRRLS